MRETLDQGIVQVVKLRSGASWLLAAFLLLAALFLVFRGARKDGPVREEGRTDSTGTFQRNQPESRDNFRPATQPERSHARHTAAPDLAAIVARAMKGNSPRLSRGDVEEFLAKRDRDSASLLLAFRETDDQAYLREALERFPEDPEVVVAALLTVLEFENRPELIDRLKSLDSDNALGNYIAASEAFAAGIDEAALMELAEASAKDFESFRNSIWQTNEEAWISAGYPEQEAKLHAAFGGTNPGMSTLMRLLHPMKELAARAAEEGDAATVDGMIRAQQGIARHMEAGGLVIDVLAAIAFERAALLATEGHDARERLAELETRKQQVLDDNKRVVALLSEGGAREADIGTWLDQVRQSGDVHANEWLLERYR